MKYLNIFYILPLIILSCSNGKTSDEKPLARVYDEYLYPSELKEILYNATSKEDSVQLIKSFTDRWAKKQVLLHFAETNLNEEDKDVTRELENYKTSLLIYKYQQLFISEKLDTIISEQEYQDYYQNHPNEFQLDQNILKLLFIQIPKSAPNPDKIRNIYGSTKDKDLKKLDDYCNKYAFKYDDFKNQWISFFNINKLLPSPVEDAVSFLKNNKQIELVDSNYYYFINIKEYQLAGTPAPLEFAKNMIASILLTERKNALLNKLENSALNEEINKKNVEIFNHD